jgi:hypothetical protein
MIGANPRHCHHPLASLILLHERGEPALKLSARAFELPNDCAALIETDKMEAILTEIDADRADGGWCGFVWCNGLFQSWRWRRYE